MSCDDADCIGICKCRVRGIDIDDLTEQLFWVFDDKKSKRKGEERLMFKETIRPYIKQLSNFIILEDTK